MWSDGSRYGGMDDLYLSRAEVALVDGEGSPWRRDGDTLDLVLDALVERLRSTRAPRAVRVWLGAALCRPVRIVPISGARSKRERWQVAETMAVAESGLTPPCRVAIDGRGAGADVAIVVEESTLAAIEHALTSVRTRVVSIRPWWAEALASALRGNASLHALGVWEGRALTTLFGDGQAFSSVQTLYPVDSADAALAAFARAQVSAMVAPEGALAISLDWSASPQGLQRVAGDRAAAVFTPWVRLLGASS